MDNPNLIDEPAAEGARSGNSSVTPGEECGCVRLGKCKWFNVAKGWGFLTPNDGGQEVFVHQSVIQMSGFRSLGEQEEVAFECQRTARGLEATSVSGRQGNDCHGSTYRPRMKTRRMRCYNCGEFANHIASECAIGPQPKRCHRCRSEDHLHADCPHRNAAVTQTNSSNSSSSRRSKSIASDEAAQAATEPAAP